jgi:hypothetical protein
MSNFLAIATVTGTLRSLLAAAAADAVQGAAVTTKRPDGAAANQEAGINIFLYQVLPNPAYRNEDLPTRRGQGELAQRPQAALVLNYLLSFSGEDKELEPQRLLGATIRQLHARPQLGKKQIESTLLTAPFSGFLKGSNLADQVDRVRFTPLSLSLDDLSKVWSVFFQSPYLLSVAYQASAVLIETDDTPSAALPVKSRALEVLPFRQPTIETVVAQEGEGAPIFMTSTLAIRGANLRSDASFVLLEETEVAPKSVAEREITVAIPPGTRAGPHAVQVVQKLMLGSPRKPHRGFESNVAMFVLHPKLSSLSKTVLPGTSTKALRTGVDVEVADSQRVALLLDSTSSAEPASFSLVPRKRPAGQETFLIDVSKVPAGTYFVRMQVDGAASPLDLDPDSASFGPTVALP